MCSRAPLRSLMANSQLEIFKVRKSRASAPPLGPRDIRHYDTCSKRRPQAISDPKPSRDVSVPAPEGEGHQGPVCMASGILWGP